MQKYYPMAIGVILDVKLYNLEPAKEALLNAIVKIPVGEDLFYLYHPDDIDPLEKKGEKIHSIFNYAKIKIHPYLALNQTSMILGSEVDEEYRRKVIFITDKYDKNYNEQIAVTLQINKSQRFDCEYFFIGIDHQDFDFNANVTILNSLEELENTLNEIFSEETNGTTIKESKD